MSLLLRQYERTIFHYIYAGAHERSLGSPREQGVWLMPAVLERVTEKSYTADSEPALAFEWREDHALVLSPGGDWLMGPALPGIDAVEKEIDEEVPFHSLQFEASRLGRWNSGLVSFVQQCRQLCQERHARFIEEGLPDGVKKLIRLAGTVPEATDAYRDQTPRSIVYKVGSQTLRTFSGFREVASFLGENVVCFGKLLRGTAQFRWSDVLSVMQQCGPQALGVVALINFLVGVILAFVGAVQLQQFGASIYVADLVAIGTVREMGCIMTAVILCGRTGAAFAAELGAMKVNEEIDAYRTFAISPMEFLVLPRIVALLAMMPILCVFADVIAIAGGYLVSTSMLEVTTTEYVRRTIEAITLQSFSLGVFKGAVFGVIVAVFGCLRGMQCGTNAAAVGQATTSAVVTGITTIVATDGIFAVLCNALNI